MTQKSTFKVFNPHRCDRIRNSNGGTIIYTDEKLKAMKVIEFRNEQCEVVGVIIRDVKTLLINIWLKFFRMGKIHEWCHFSSILVAVYSKYKQ